MLTSHKITFAVGAPLAGRISDHNIQKWRKNRGDKWVPEDRLRGTLFAAAVLVPLSVLAIGVITQYVEGRLGLTLNLVFLFFNGFGVSFTRFYVLVSSTLINYSVIVPAARHGVGPISFLRSRYLPLPKCGVDGRQHVRSRSLALLNNPEHDFSYEQRISVFGISACHDADPPFDQSHRCSLYKCDSCRCRLDRVRVSIHFMSFTCVQVGAHVVPYTGCCG